MKCPFCGDEMEAGFVQSNGSALIWTNKKHRFSILADSSKGEIQLDHVFNSASITASICRKCKKIIAEY
jgi:hypothetical protein